MFLQRIVFTKNVSIIHFKNYKNPEYTFRSNYLQLSQSLNSYYSLTLYLLKYLSETTKIL